MPERHRVATTSEIPAEGGLCVQVQGHEIAIFQRDGSYFASDNECPHASGPLCEGTVSEKGITCPWHDWTFDLATGASSRNAAIKLKTYPVVVEGDEVHVEL